MSTAGPGFIGLGALVYDPDTSKDTNDDYRKLEIRSKIYQQMQPKHMVKAPLTKALFSHKGKPVENSEFKWPRMRELAQFGYVAGCYSNATLVTEYANGAAPGYASAADVASGTTVYLEVPRTIAVDIQPYETFKIHDRTRMNFLVLDAVSIDYANAAADAANAVITATLLHDDDGDRGNVLGCDKTSNNCVIHPLSMAMPELSQLADGYTEEPTMESNYAQIFSEAFSLSGSKLSDGNIFDISNYNSSFRQAHERFMKQFEWAAMFGIRGTSSKPVSVVAHGSQKDGRRWMTGGVVSALDANADADGNYNYIRVPRVTDFEGQDFTGVSWDSGAYDFVKRLMLRLSKFSGNDKEVYMSSRAMQDLIDVFEGMTQVTISSDHKDAWGFDITKVKGLNCTLNLHQHRMFNTIPAYSKAALIIEPELLQWRPKKGRDITFISSTGAEAIANNKGAVDGWTWRDGVKEGWIADGGIQYDNLEAMAFVDGIGEDFYS